MVVFIQFDFSGTYKGTIKIIRVQNKTIAKNIIENIESLHNFIEADPQQKVNLKILDVKFFVDLCLLYENDFLKSFFEEIPTKSNTINSANLKYLIDKPKAVYLF